MSLRTCRDRSRRDGGPDARRGLHRDISHGLPSEWLSRVGRQDADAGPCDLGEIMQFGDSLLEAGIVSHGLPLVSTNFSAGGLSPMDSYFLVHRALACPNFPKRALLSFGVADFLQIQEAFWANTIRFGIHWRPRHRRHRGYSAASGRLVVRRLCHLRRVWRVEP